MDPPPSPSLATPPLGLGAAILTGENSTGSLSPLQQHQHYQYNMSHHRWPDFANFMNYPHPPPPPSHPHPGFTTFSGSGMIMGEAYHSYHHHHHHQVINGISMFFTRRLGDVSLSREVAGLYSRQWTVCCGCDLSGRIRG